jgi:(1->4)-alpha-D-glucan 1-alpha-D-glucosylmutase
VKRRLAALVNTSPAVATLIDASVRAINGIAGEPRSFDRLDRLLNAQSYRLAHWRVASEEINYRRFFDVNELAALRMEDPAVFEEVHRFAFELVRRGAATGLRIDHVDGLYAPADYLRRLQDTLAANPDTGESEARPFYVVVEKILTRDEQLSTEWPVYGTTGYEFAAVVNNLFVDARNARAFDDIYTRFVRRLLADAASTSPIRSFDDLVYQSKKRVLHETMSGDINWLGHQLNRFSERNRHFRDFTLYSLISTLKELIACFPVYRTYIVPEGRVSDSDRRYIADAMRCAKRRARGLSTLVFDFIERLLLKQTPVGSVDECEARARFIGKFQQITSPVAAKGLEDTALYTYNRLLSLNDVGMDPTQFGLDPSAVHAWMARRNQQWPHALSATSTHDTKRGEDVRARLNVLSEIPGAWKAAIVRWRALNRRFKTAVHGVLAPDPNEEYLLYQTLVGVWPFEMTDEARPGLRLRVAAFMTKALREAKVHTNWVSPDESYEAAVIRFVEAMLDPRRSAPFLRSFEELQSRVAQHGVYNSLAQLVIKIAAPGVPDFYQGTELWDLHLVDPDNRHSVDYAGRAAALASIECADPATLLEHRSDGRIKMFTMRRALAARAAERDLFERGDYQPLQTSGTRRDCVFAFARVGGNAAAITCVPRLIASLVPEANCPPTGPSVWSDTRIELPPDLVSRAEGRSLRDVFTGAELDVAPALPAAAVFERFPVALLVLR